MTNTLLLGAGSDIAVSLAYVLAAQKHNLLLAARNLEHLKEIAADLRIRHQVETHCLAFDALDYQSHAQFYCDLPLKPDVAICAFGYLGDQEIAMRDFKEAQKILASNFIGAVSILNVVAADFAQRQSGTIVGISSVAGDRGRQSNYLYGSAKAGFSAYLSGLRNRMFSSNVHVLTVKPGFVRTKMTANLQLPPVVTASPEQVAKNIYKALRRKHNILYSLWMWKYIMLIINSIPEFIFKKLRL